MKSFLQLIKARWNLTFKFILVGIFLISLPGANYFNQLDLVKLKPIINSTDFQLPPPADYPVIQTKAPAPYLSAQGAVVIDADSKTIIFAKNPDQWLLPASTTKIMTALVALDNYSLDDVVTVGEIITEPVKMNLFPGEKITVNNLLYGLLVGSANDAALALATHFPQDEVGFVKAMNQKAADLNLSNTQYTNPIGLDNYGQYTTVHDLSLLTAAAMNQPVFRSIVNTLKYTVTDVDKTKIHELENLNQLLGQIPGLVGVKTGYTDLAGECLVTFVTRNNRSIITVVLGSADRFGESQRLIDWVFTNFAWQSLPPTTR
mgnify:CR=1 FL=1